MRIKTSNAPTTNCTGDAMRARVAFAIEISMFFSRSMDGYNLKRVDIRNISLNWSEIEIQGGEKGRGS